MGEEATGVGVEATLTRNIFFSCAESALATEEAFRQIADGEGKAVIDMITSGPNKYPKNNRM